MENIFSTITSSFTLSILIISIIINIVLAFLIFKNNPKSATNKLFTLLSLSMVFWLIGFYISIQVKPFIFNSLVWIRLSLFFATLMMTLFFLFSHTFPSAKLKLSKKLLLIILFFNLLIMLISISPYTFTHTKIINNFPSPIPGPGLPVFIIFVLILIFESIYILIKKYINSFGLEKKQLLFIIWGFSLMHFFMFSTVLIPVALFQKTNFVPLFPIYTLIFTGIATYTITRYRLFNIKLITIEVITFIIWIILFSKIFTVNTVQGILLDSLIFIFIIFFGILLIKNVKKEIENREEIEKLALQLQAANEKLKHLDKAKTEFLSIASHQLRTPLTTVKGYSSLLLEGMYGKLSPKIKIIVERIFLSNERLVKLVGELLDISRIERNKFVFKFQYASLKEIINDIVENIQLKAEQKNLKIKYHQPKNKLPLIYLDHDKLYDVFYNLLDNAIKYTEKGNVEISYELRDSEIIVSIKDTGMGLTKEDLSLIFSKFQRGHDSFKMDTEGLGLGLHVAKKIIDAHKGRIWAESPGKNKGATFFVALPISLPVESN